jgi:hypothetical protein
MPKKLPNGYWKNWSNVKPILLKLMEENEGLLPTSKTFREKKLTTVLVSLKYHGGLSGARKKLGVNNLKKCVECKTILPLEVFRTKKHKKGLFRNNTCRPCEQSLVLKYRTTWPGRAAEMNRRSKERAKKFGYAHDLDKYWILEKLRNNNFCCQLTNIKLNPKTVDTGVGFANRYGASLDRIDSSKGYTKNNVRIIANRMNIALGNLSDEQFEEFALGFLRNKGYRILNDKQTAR